MWHLLKQVFLSFFYGQSARTPPPSGNFTHSTKQERGETVVELELVYQFTITSESTLPEVVTQIRSVFVEQVVFLTVNHRGPLPLKELHSTDEICVWRDPRGS